MSLRSCLHQSAPPSQSSRLSRRSQARCFCPLSPDLLLFCLLLPCPLLSCSQPPLRPAHSPKAASAASPPAPAPLPCPSSGRIQICRRRSCRSACRPRHKGRSAHHPPPQSPSSPPLPPKLKCG